MLFSFLNKMPVRLRLSVGHATCMALLYVAIGAGLSKVIEKSLYESVDNALITTARSVRDARFTWGMSPGREDAIDHFLSHPLQVNQLIGERYIRPFAQIINITGKIHSKTDNVHVPLPVTPRSISRAEKGQWSFETFHMKKDSQLRQVTLPIMEQGKFTGEIIQVGASLRHTLDTLNGITIILFTILPSLLVISVLLGYIFTARALKPVQNIGNAAARLGIDDLSIRLPLPEANDELRNLSLTFNSMLDRLEDAVKRLRRFTGDVSHELRTPLAVIRGESELALRRERSGEEYQRSLTSINKESKNMTVIIEDLLLLARAESKSIAMNWETIAAQVFVDDMVDQVGKFFAARSVKLATHIQQIETISCAQGFLTIALKNILTNAAKHSVPGSTVHFTVRRVENQTEFLIQDEGEGIPKESLPYIFDPFYRADTARNRATGGVGIGLSLALALVKLHQGSIKVFANHPKGTTFQALIPVG